MNNLAPMKNCPGGGGGGGGGGGQGNLNWMPGYCTYSFFALLCFQVISDARFSFFKHLSIELRRTALIRKSITQISLVIILKQL